MTRTLGAFAHWSGMVGPMDSGEKALGEYTKDELNIMHLEEELSSALRKLAAVLVGDRGRDEVAWWLCANHARFIIDHPNLNAEGRLIEMASSAGSPPRGPADWNKWFERVRNLPAKSP